MLVMCVWAIRIFVFCLLILALMVTLTKINIYINFNRIDNNIYITYLSVFKYTLYHNGFIRTGRYYKHKVKKMQKQARVQAQIQKTCQGIKDNKIKTKNPLVEDKFKDNESLNKIDTFKNIIKLFKNNKKISVVIKAFIAHISINFNVKYIYFYSDPHITAFFYGVLNSLKFNLDILLCQYFKINRSEMLICPDFEKRENNVDISIKLSVKLINIFILTLKLVPFILKYKKSKKAV